MGGKRRGERGGFVLCLEVQMRCAVFPLSLVTPLFSSQAKALIGLLLPLDCFD